MLRVACYYESRLGRNDGNPLYIWRALKRRQAKGELEVDHLAPTGDLNPYGNYDLHIWVDWGEDGLTGFLPYQPIYPPGKPMIYWASDTHLGFDYRLNCAKQADIAFCAQERAVEEFKQQGINSIWLPHAFEPEAYPKYTLASKKYDVAFVGHINSENRVEALDQLFSNFPNFFYGQRRFEQAAHIYAESKIVFNISMKDDLNMRVFEAMGSGSMLLTNDIPSIHTLFKDGVHLVTYKDSGDMVEKARYYLEHDEERERIAQAGYQEVINHHTIDHRLDKMLETYRSLKKELV